MAPTNASSSSNIAAALAAHSRLDGNNPKHSKVAVGSSSGGGHPAADLHPMLPTPPNSISPTLPPRKPSDQPRRPSFQVESDIDLQDTVDGNYVQDQDPAPGLPLSKAALSGLESVGGITPAMLAQHYLPSILLNHGPMAIRHVLGHLTQTVPGFSGIVPAKARRLVVSALESKAGGGASGEVQFEKVGWGRWDAHIKGQPSREGHVSPPASLPDVYSAPAGAVRIPPGRRGARDRRESWTGGSSMSLRDVDVEDMNMAEHEADKMSLDGSDQDIDVEGDSFASLSAVPEAYSPSEDSGDETEEEDWQSIGAEALRKESELPPSEAMRQENRDYNYLSRIASANRHKSSHRGRGHGPSSTLPLQRRYHGSQLDRLRNDNQEYRLSHSPTDFSSHSYYGQPSPANLSHSPQEREAVEALLRMGST